MLRQVPRHSGHIGASQVSSDRSPPIAHVRIVLLLRAVQKFRVLATGDTIPAIASTGERGVAGCIEVFETYGRGLVVCIAALQVRAGATDIVAEESVAS